MPEIQQEKEDNKERKKKSNISFIFNNCNTGVGYA